MRRAPLLLIVPLATLSMVACGDDDDDEPSDTTTEDITDETTEETTDTTDVESEGSVESDDTLPGGITIPELTLPEDLTLPSIEEGDVVDGLRQIFPDLDEDQAQCLAEAFDLGSGELPDLSNLNTGLLDDCNINISDLVPG